MSFQRAHLKGRVLLVKGHGQQPFHPSSSHVYTLYTHTHRRSWCQHLSDRYKVSICHSGSQERGAEQALSVNRYHDNGRSCPIPWPLCVFIELAHRLPLWVQATVIENTSREEDSKKEGCASVHSIR